MPFGALKHQFGVYFETHDLSPHVAIPLMPFGALKRTDDDSGVQLVEVVRCNTTNALRGLFQPARSPAGVSA